MKVDGDKLTKNMTDNLKKTMESCFLGGFLQMVVLMYW